MFLDAPFKNRCKGNGFVWIRQIFDIVSPLFGIGIWTYAEYNMYL